MSEPVKERMMRVPRTGDVVRFFNHQGQFPYSQKCVCGIVLRVCEPHSDYIATAYRCPNCGPVIAGSVRYAGRFQGMDLILNDIPPFPSGWNMDQYSTSDYLDDIFEDRNRE